MAVLPRKLAAVVSALAVLFAQAACLCHAGRAGVARAATLAAIEHETPSKPAHACCRHAADKSTDSQPQPAKPRETCRHCAGQVTTALRPTTDGVSVGLELQSPVFASAAVPSVVVASSETALADPVGELAIPYPRTLLRLHCALNL